jgi:hypothetical protein
MSALDHPDPGELQPYLDAPVANATEAAQVLSVLVAKMPRKAVEDLHAMLALRIAVPPRAARRDARLGLLMDLLIFVGGYITEPVYEAERQRRKPAGQHWPSVSQLRVDWGHWMLAVQAAARLLGLGGRARVGSPPNRPGPWKKTENPQDILWAIQRAHQDLDDWPTEWEFDLYIGLQRRLGREHPASVRGVALPTAKEVRRDFGSYDRACELAQWAVGVPLDKVLAEVERVVQRGHRRKRA